MRKDTGLRSSYLSISLAWKNIGPKLEPLLQHRKEERLERERRARRLDREKDLMDLVYHTRKSVVGLELNSWELLASTPPKQDIFDFPQVRQLLEIDTDGITLDQYRAVESHICTMMQRYFRRVLQNVLFALEGHAGDSKSICPPDENQDHRNIIEDISVMKSKLSLVTSAWVCRVGGCRTIHWFPQILSFMDCFKPVEDLGRVLRNASPLDADGTLLLQRMLVDLGLDPDSGTVSEVTNLTNITCARCDPRVAKYSTFAEIVRN